MLFHCCFAADQYGNDMKFMLCDIVHSRCKRTYGFKSVVRFKVRVTSDQKCCISKLYFSVSIICYPRWFIHNSDFNFVVNSWCQSESCFFFGNEKFIMLCVIKVHSRCILNYRFFLQIFAAIQSTGNILIKSVVYHRCWIIIDHDVTRDVISALFIKAWINSHVVSHICCKFQMVHIQKMILLIQAVFCVSSYRWVIQVHEARTSFSAGNIEIIFCCLFIAECQFAVIQMVFVQ